MELETSLLLFLGYVGVVSFIGHHNLLEKVADLKDRRFGDRREENRRAHTGRRMNSFNENHASNERRESDGRRNRLMDRRHKSRRHHPSLAIMH